LAKSHLYLASLGAWTCAGGCLVLLLRGARGVLDEFHPLPRVMLPVQHGLVVQKLGTLEEDITIIESVSWPYSVSTLFLFSKELA
jgi:hypothetical protein